jgi:dihydroorotase
MAALKGGVTTLLDMPNNRPPTTSPARLDRKRTRFGEKCLVNWGLHLQGTTGMRGEGRRTPAASVKIYMSRASQAAAVTEVPQLAAIFGRYQRVSIHAEDETRFLAPARRTHAEARPVAAIASALEKIEAALRSLPPARRCRLVLCHVSTAIELAWLARMKGEGMDVWGETCPHYWLFTQEDQLIKGSLLKVNPPLRDPADREAILAALAGGPLDLVSSDHAPHTRAEKAAASPPSGIAGIEWMLPLLLSLVLEGRMGWQRFHQLAVENPCRCYGLTGRDGIRVGNWADLVLVAPHDEPLDSGPSITGAGICPYAGLRLRMRVATTWVNGIAKYVAGEFPDETPGMEVVG